MLKHNHEMLWDIKLPKLLSYSKKNSKRDLPSQVNDQELTTLLFDH